MAPSVLLKRATLELWRHLELSSEPESLSFLVAIANVMTRQASGYPFNIQRDRGEGLTGCYVSL